MTYTSDVIEVIDSGVPTTNNVEWVDSGIGTYNILKNTLSDEDFLTALESKYTNRFTKLSSCSPLSYNPKAWYRSDGFYQDAAVQFTASDKSWLQIADASQTGLDPGTNDFLIMGWLYCDTVTNGTIVRKKGSDNPGYSLTTASDGTLTCYVGATSPAVIHSSSGVITSGKWIFVAGLFDRDSNYTGYVGDATTSPISVVSGSIAAAAGNADTTSAFTIGAAYSETAFFDGRIDSLMFFKAADLSGVAADIISWAYNSGSGRLSSDITEAQKTAWGAVSCWDLGEACYDEQTEVLTENGWKFFKEVAKGEKVATLDAAGVMTYAEPLEYHEYDHDGPMFHQRGRSIDVMVTPNHTMYVRRASQTPQDSTDTVSGFERIQAKDMPKRVTYKRDMMWKGQEQDFFTLPEFRKTYVCTKNQQVARRANATKLCNDKWGRNDVVAVDDAAPATYERVWEEKRIPMDVWLRFFGVWLAKGWASTTEDSRKVGVAQSLKANPQNYSEIEEILSDLGYNFCKMDRGFEISDIQLHAYLSQFGKSYEKFIPKDIKSLSPRQLHVLYSGMHLGDGWDKPNGYGYGTCSKRLADDVQEIVSKMGMVATLRHIPVEKQSSFVCGRPKQSGHDFYSLSITKKSQVCNVNVRGKDLRSWPNYTGKVYCLTVPNGLLYVRRNGCVCWCGNSGTRYDSWGTNHLSQSFANIIQPPVYGSELLTNGGFETAGAGGADVFGTWSDNAGDGTIARDTSIYYADSASASLTAGSNTNTSVSSPSITVTPGQTYRFSVWTRGDGTYAGRYYFTDNVGLFLTGYAAYYSTTVTGTNWTLITKDITIPAGKTQIQVCLRCPATNGGTAWFDSVSLKAVTTSALNNGGFESWTVPSAANQCAAINGNLDTAGGGGADVFDTWVETAGSGAIAAESTIVHTAGGNSAKLSTVTGAAYMYLPVSSLTATGVYKLSFWAYGDGTNAGRYAITSGDGLTAYVGATSTEVTAATWTKVEKIFILPSGQTACRIYLYSNASTASDVYFDDVELTQLPSNVDTWTESVAGSSLIYREDAAPYHGSHALAMQVDGSGTAAKVQLSSNLTVGKTYSYTLYAKAASGTPGIRVGTATTYNTETLSTSYAKKTNTFVADATTFEISCVTASATVYLDSLVELATVELPAPGIVRGLAQDSNFAVSLNGTSQYLNYSGTAFDPGTGDFSIFGAFYCDKTISNATQEIIHTARTWDAGQKGYTFRVLAAGNIRVSCSDGVGTHSQITSTDTLLPGVWYTFVLNFDRDGNLVCYINGVSFLTLDITNQTGSITPGVMYLGSDAVSAGFFDGDFDNIGYANRLLTPAEIIWLHNNGEWRQWAELGVAGTDGENLTSDVIKGFWEFDDASNLGLDSSGNGNNLTPQGSPTQTQGINYLEGIVSYIIDQSSNSYHMTQETLAKRPSFISNALNTYGIMRFDGVDDYFDSGIAGLANATIFYVGKITSAETYPLGVVDTNNRSYITSDSSDYFGGGIANDDYSTIVSDEDATSYFIGVIDNDGTNVHLYFNGGLEYTCAQDGIISTSENYYVGALNNAGTAESYFIGDIAEIIIFDSAIARTYRRNILRYLSNRYNITVSYS